jgi:hypothetical protein
MVPCEVSNTAYIPGAGLKATSRECKFEVALSLIPGREASVAVEKAPVRFYRSAPAGQSAKLSLFAACIGVHCR